MFWKKKNTRKTYSRPIFAKKQPTEALYKVRKKSWIKIDASFMNKLYTFYYIVGFLAFSWLIYFFAFSDYFKVESVEIMRQNNNANIEIAYSSIGRVKGKNIFWLDVVDMKRKILNNQANLRWVVVSKKFPRNIAITLQSYPDIFQTTVEERDYLVLQNWSIVPWTNEELMNIELKYANFPNFYEYKQILKQEELALVTELASRMKDNFLDAKTEKINFYVEAKEVHFILETWATIMFDLASAPAAQIEKVAVFNEENQKINTNTLIYADARVEKRLFYCDVESEFNCYNNLAFIYGVER